MISKLALFSPSFRPGFRLAAVSVLAVACWTSCQSKPQISSTTPVDPSRPGGINTGGAGDDQGPRGGSSGGPGIVLPDSGPMETSAPPAATEDANCGLQDYKLQRRPAEMLLILDRSGSMRESPNPLMFGGPSKWDETVPAVRETIMKTANVVQWGLKLFPASPDFMACVVNDGVEVPPAIDNFTKIDGAITLTTPTGTGTPTRYAIDKAVAYFKANASTNARYLVLATDGEPNCADGVTNALVDPDGSVMAVAAATAAGYKTFVIGIATSMSNANMTLNLLADAGGSPRMGDPRYYPVASRADLIAALSQITGKVADCVFPLDKLPPTPDSVAVDVDGMRIQRDPAKMNGWEYGAGNKTVEVYGAACEQIKKGTANVKIIFGCPGREIP